MSARAWTRWIPTAAIGIALLLIGFSIYKVVRPGLEKAPRTDQERQSATIRLLRSLGTAVEEYSINHNLYPRQESVGESVDSLEADLVPAYLRELISTDAWDRPVIYWSDTNSYFVVSAGSDRRFDREYDGDTRTSELLEVTQDPANDIVFMNGRFVQGPSAAYP